VLGSVYELSQSLGIAGRKYTYDMYTAVPEHTYENLFGKNLSRVVVGITDGVTAYDAGYAIFQAERQAHFPLPLLEKAVTFKSREEQASKAEDKAKILSSIGEGHEDLDNLVHGVMARAGLGKALAAYGPGERLEPFLQGLTKGRVRDLEVNFKSVPEKWHTEGVMRAIVEAVDPETIETLMLSDSKAAGDWLAPLVGRKFEKLRELRLDGCKGLQSLPEGVFNGMGALEELSLRGCEGLQSLPKGVFDGISALKELDLAGCEGLQSLPEGVFDRMGALERLYLECCQGLQSLPESVFNGMGALKELNLCYCERLQSLPEGVFNGMGALEELSLRGCEGLQSLPEGVFAGMGALKTLDLDRCPAAESLPQSVRQALEAHGCKIHG
jgi:hypothetical protein